MVAAVNAAPSKQTTHLHVRFLDDHTHEARELRSARRGQPTLPEDEVETEGQVILEEIAMYEDEPQDRVHDVLAEAIHGDSPIGRRVLGSSDVIASVSIPSIRSYHDAHYSPPNVVVSAAGHIEHERIVSLAQRHLGLGSAPLPGRLANGAAPGPTFRFYPKETEQYHVCFGGQGISRGDDRRFALGVLDAAFGGSSSSRLFREVREKRGLAYSVGSYTEQFVDDGAVAMYVGTREDNVAEACEIIGRELGKLHSEGITDDELARAKEHVKGRMVLGLESTSARMSRIARGILFDVPLLSIDEM